MQGSGADGLSGAALSAGVINPVITQNQVTTSYVSDTTPSSRLSGSGTSGVKSSSTFEKNKFSSFSSNLGTSNNLYQAGSDGNFSILKQLHGVGSDGSYKFTYVTLICQIS